MKVAMMQPTFLPWCGFFELVGNVDRFLFLDDFQFSVQSYHQRNRLFISPGTVGWYSLPIDKKQSFGQPINRAKLAADFDRKKMWKRIEANYQKTAYFAELSDTIRQWLFGSDETVSEFNTRIILGISKILNFKCDWHYSSKRPSDLRRSERVVDLLRWCEAETYYCARGAFEYMARDGVFPIDDCRVLFQDHQCQPYSQLGSRDGQFQPYLSVIDALFNVGPEKTRDVVLAGTSSWKTWDEMMKAPRDHED